MEILSEAKAWHEWLEEHWLAAWVANQIARQKSTGASDLPAELHASLRKAELVAMAREAVRTQCLEQLMGAMHRHGVAPILFKGVGVAYQYYSPPHLRPYGDIDLLVAPAELERAVSAAKSVGYVEQNDDPAVRAYYREAEYNLPLVHPKWRWLEIHHNLYRDCEPAFVTGVLERAVPGTFLEVPVRRLSPPDLFLVLATHFGTSSVGSRWLWLLDLVLLGRALDSAEWDQVMSLSRAHGLSVFAAGALALMDRLWRVRFDDGRIERTVRNDLRLPERMALDRLLQRINEGPASDHVLAIPRRLSGRPVHGSMGLASSVFCHPGAVCLEYGVHSQSPEFWRYRLTHPFRRLRRAAESLAQTLRAPSKA
jgi:hypothetical protein